MGLPIVRDVQRPFVPHALPTVLKLEALWQQLQAQRLGLSRRLWRRVRTWQLLRARPIDAAGVRITAPVGKINDCGGCTDLCCVGAHNTVLLRLRDVATLIDLGQTHLIARGKPSFSADVLARRPALRRHVASTAWRRFPVLAQNAFGACMALSASGKCGLYPYWPMSCARFPYALDVEASETFYSGRCRSFWVHPRDQPAQVQMSAAAVAGYNERIKDALLLRFCAESLADLDLLRYLGD